jgi:hypothetical protein
VKINDWKLQHRADLKLSENLQKTRAETHFVFANWRCRNIGPSIPNKMRDNLLSLQLYSVAFNNENNCIVALDRQQPLTQSRHDFGIILELTVNLCSSLLS